MLQVPVLDDPHANAPQIEGGPTSLDVILRHLAGLSQTLNSGWVNGYGTISLKLSDNSLLFMQPVALLDWNGLPLGTQTNPVVEAPQTGAVWRVNAGGLAQGQSQKNYVFKQATAIGGITTVNIETVTTGKTYYITDLIIQTDQATIMDIRLQQAGVDIFRIGMRDIAPVNAAGVETQPQAPSGSAVTFVLPQTGSVQQVWGNIFGIEQ